MYLYFKFIITGRYTLNYEEVFITTEMIVRKVIANTSKNENKNTVV